MGTRKRNWSGKRWVFCCIPMNFYVVRMFVNHIFLPKRAHRTEVSMALNLVVFKTVRYSASFLSNEEWETGYTGGKAHMLIPKWIHLTHGMCRNKHCIYILVARPNSNIFYKGSRLKTITNIHRNKFATIFVCKMFFFLTHTLALLSSRILNEC